MTDFSSVGAHFATGLAAGLRQGIVESFPARAALGGVILVGSAAERAQNASAYVKETAAYVANAAQEKTVALARVVKNQAVAVLQEPYERVVNAASNQVNAFAEQRRSLASRLTVNFTGAVSLAAAVIGCLFFSAWSISNFKTRPRQAAVAVLAVGTALYQPRHVVNAGAAVYTGGQSLARAYLDPAQNALAESHAERSQDFDADHWSVIG